MRFRPHQNRYAVSSPPKPLCGFVPAKTAMRFRPRQNRYAVSSPPKPLCGFVPAKTAMRFRPRQNRYAVSSPPKPLCGFVPAKTAMRFRPHQNRYAVSSPPKPLCGFVPTKTAVRFRPHQNRCAVSSPPKPLCGFDSPGRGVSAPARALNTPPSGEAESARRIRWEPGRGEAAENISLRRLPIGLLRWRFFRAATRQEPIRHRPERLSHPRKQKNGSATAPDQSGAPGSLAGIVAIPRC